jgi:phospholipase A-2-activating protein
MDSHIRIFDSAGNMVGKLEGHSKGIISFSWTSNGLLISGSWDGQARIWNIATLASVQFLGPHENGVHVLGLSNSLVATVSTGESVDGKPANFKLRFWDPTNRQLIGNPIQDHSGSIRSITNLSSIGGFLTTANDGTAKIRTSDGQEIGTVYHQLQEDGSPPFVLDRFLFYRLL